MTYREYKRRYSDIEDVNYVQGELEKIVLSLSKRIDELQKRIKKLEEA